MGNFCSCVECVPCVEEPSDEEIEISMLYNRGVISYDEMLVQLKVLQADKRKESKDKQYYMQ